MNKHKIGTMYVVHGECGEYSNARRWLCAVFNLEQQARDFAQELDRLWVAAGRPVDESSWSHPLDERWLGDDQGTRYTVTSADHLIVWTDAPNEWFQWKAAK